MIDRRTLRWDRTAEEGSEEGVQGRRAGCFGPLILLLDHLLRPYAQLLLRILGAEPLQIAGELWYARDQNRVWTSASVSWCVRAYYVDRDTFLQLSD